MNRTFARFSLAASAALGVCACNATSRRVKFEPRAAALAVIAPSPPDSAAAPSSAPIQFEQVIVGTMSESERTEKLRASGWAPPPPPLPPPPAPIYRDDSRPIVVERRVVVEEPSWSAYHRSYYDSSYYPYHSYRYGCGPWLGRAATFTLGGALIGRQFHHGGRGAAIGAGLALLTVPFGCGWDRCCDD